MCVIVAASVHLMHTPVHTRQSERAAGLKRRPEPFSSGVVHMTRSSLSTTLAADANRL
jgi:hypothetical protein